MAVEFFVTMEFMEIHGGWRGIGVFGLCLCTPSCTLRVPSARAERPAAVSA